MLAGLTRIGRPALIALGLSACLATTRPAQAALIWTWSYGAPGISAGGTITTGDVADSQGFYLVTGISGTRNGIAITGLQPAGTAIPGNEPFVVDDLISVSGPQLTGEGFGYSTADGNFANTFFASFLSPATYLEFFSAPPFTTVIGPEDSELPVGFFAAASEPGTAAVVGIGLLGLVTARRRARLGCA